MVVAGLRQAQAERGFSVPVIIIGPLRLSLSKPMLKGLPQ